MVPQALHMVRTVEPGKELSQCSNFHTPPVFNTSARGDPIGKKTISLRKLEHQSYQVMKKF